VTLLDTRDWPCSWEGKVPAIVRRRLVMWSCIDIDKREEGGGMLTAQSTLLIRSALTDKLTDGTCGLENINYSIHTKISYTKAIILQSGRFSLVL
jgi:hypothetical protein